MNWGIRTEYIHPASYNNNMLVKNIILISTFKKFISIATTGPLDSGGLWVRGLIGLHYDPPLLFFQFLFFFNHDFII